MTMIPTTPIAMYTIPFPEPDDCDCPEELLKLFWVPVRVEELLNEANEELVDMVTCF
jgi:hypothetical protein